MGREGLGRARCSKQLAPIAARNARFRSNPPRADLFTVANAGRSAEERDEAHAIRWAGSGAVSQVSDSFLNFFLRRNLSNVVNSLIGPVA